MIAAIKPYSHAVIALRSFRNCRRMVVNDTGWSPLLRSRQPNVPAVVQTRTRVVSLQALA
jgi:hypothetical protein